jgi:hypothetical protein
MAGRSEDRSNIATIARENELGTVDGGIKRRDAAHNALQSP